jgi:hypothetical protein
MVAADFDRVVLNIEGQLRQRGWDGELTWLAFRDDEVFEEPAGVFSFSEDVDR